MEYNKKNFQKTNDKKILHKVRKHWVVISTAMLMAIGGGAAATHVSANADATNNNNHSQVANTNTLKERLNSSLQTATPQQSNANVRSQQSSNAGSASSNAIQNQANVLHNRILQNATVNSNHQNNVVNSSANHQTTANNAGLGRVQVPGFNVGNSNSGTQQHYNANNDPSKSDHDEMYTVGQNNVKYNSKTKTYYSDDYSDVTDPSDNGSDYGVVTVRYYDPSHNQLVGPIHKMGPEMGVGNTLGQKGRSFSNNVQSFEQLVPNVTNGNAPYGYQLASNGSGYAPVDSGSGIQNYIAGEDQYLTINVLPKPAPKSGGIITVQYKDTTNNDAVIGTDQDQESDGHQFNQAGYTDNLPDGYQLAGNNSWLINKPNTDNDFKTGNGGTITNFNDQNQTLTIFVTPSTNPNSHLTNDTALVNYINENTNAVVTSNVIQGDVGKPINVDTSLLPAGYQLDTSKGTNGVTFNGGDKFLPNNKSVATVYMTPMKSKHGNHNITPQPLPLHYGDVNIAYYLSDGTGHAKPNTPQLNGFNFTGPFGKTVSMRNFMADVPDGYKATGTGYDASDSTKTINSNSTLTFNHQAQNYIVLVEDNGKSKTSGVVNDTIQYMKVDPNQPTSDQKPEKISDNKNDNYTFQIHGQANTEFQPSDLLNRYASLVPQGYVFARFGNHNLQNLYESNENNVILVEPVDSLIHPITFHYINQNGSDVTPSTDKQVSRQNGFEYGDDIGIDANEQSGKYPAKTSKGATNILNYDPMPTGYSLDKGQSDENWQVGNYDQTVNLLVHGNNVNPTPNSDNAWALHVNQKIVDPSGNPVKMVEITDNIQGSVGEHLTINPDDYWPTPASDYTPSSKEYGVTITNNGLTQYQLKNQTTEQNGQPLPTTTVKDAQGNPHQVPTITFIYDEHYATANVVYKDPSDNNIQIGTRSIFGVPNTAMSNYYKTLDNNVPYGYNDAMPASSNATKLENGYTYVINVKNAHLQPKPSPEPIPDHGSIEVNYVDSATGKKLSSDNVSDKIGDVFDYRPYMTSSANGGKMPSFYSNAKLTSAEQDQVNAQQYDPNAQRVKFTANKQTFEIDVTKNSNPKVYNTVVSDMIVYAEVNSDGSSVINPDLSSVTIYGKNGSTIDYVPYMQDTPSGTYSNNIHENGTLYDQGQNTATNPIAVIYVKQAKEATNNKFPGYDPNHANSDLPKSDNVPNDPTNPNAPKQGPYNPNMPGRDRNAYNKDYYPSDNTSADNNRPNVPVDPGENVHYPDGYSNNEVNNEFGGNSDGFVLKGYVPGWIPDPTHSGKYTNGYVPSDDIPSGYAPGFVPNGKGGYVPGYVDPSNLPTNGNSTNKNGGKNIPSYVPGQVPSGHTDKDGKVIYVPGYVPNQPGYAPKGSASSIDIQYVDASNHADVIQGITANGKVGAYLDLNKNDKPSASDGYQYLEDVPDGYTYASTLGVPGSNNSYKPSADGKYQFTSAPFTVQIAVNQNAVGNVIYEDADNNYAQVGNAKISGVSGTPVNYKQYLTLLPYNYTQPSVAPTNPKKLYNGETFVIDVHEAHNRPAPAPQPQPGYGAITINYVKSNDHTQVLSTDQLTGKVGTNIQNQSAYMTLSKNGGLVPYGYKNPQIITSDGINTNFLSTAQFGTKPQSVDIAVDYDQSTSNHPTPLYTNWIKYQVVNPKTGNDVVLDYSKNGKSVVPSDNSNADHSNPVEFKIYAKANSVIDYTPYETNVPQGYYYDGLGKHTSSVVAGNGVSDYILLRQAKPAIQQTGAVTVDYKYNGNSPLTLNGHTYHNGDMIASITSSDQPVGSPFDLGYFEGDVPSGTQYADTASGANISKYTATPGGQKVVIDVSGIPKPKSPYGSVQIKFVKASSVTPGSTPQSNHWQSVGHSETMTGKTGTLFSPARYEDFTPANTKFHSIVSGDDIASYPSSDDHSKVVYIAVDSTDNQF